jgi:transposase
MSFMAYSLQPTDGNRPAQSAYHFERIGLEAGPLSQWLFNALAEVELPVVCVETRHMQAVLKAQINKRTATMRVASLR